MAPHAILSGTFASLASDLERLTRDVTSAAEEARSLIDAVHPEHRRGAENLIHYLALRDHDCTELQHRLHDVGLSSLGRSEARVLHNLQTVCACSRRLAGDDEQDLPGPDDPVTPADARRLLRHHADALLHEPLRDRTGRIMVTAPTELADDERLADDLVAAGLDILRVNTAHDDEVVWRRMIANIRRSARRHDREIPILMDLAGPKVRVGDLAEGADIPRVFIGDVLELHVDPDHLGGPGSHDENGTNTSPHHYGCTMPELLRAVPAGQYIAFNDGKIGGTVRAVHDDKLVIDITDSRPGKGRNLKPEKGINFPGLALGLPALTARDRELVPVVSELADMVALSFAHCVEDVEELIALLERQGNHDGGIVLKIETQEGFEALPQMLLTGMRRRRIGIMAARGDLAVEVGFARLAELQEEILWLCEAAHVPVIWATQVLESLAKKGLPSRGDITDAAFAQRAECVMLNKGPQIADAVRTLDDIQRRMAGHQDKKLDLLRRLRSWRVPGRTSGPR